MSTMLTAECAVQVPVLPTRALRIVTESAHAPSTVKVGDDVLPVHSNSSHMVHNMFAWRIYDPSTYDPNDPNAPELPFYDPNDFSELASACFLTCPCTSI